MLASVLGAAVGLALGDGKIYCGKLRNRHNQKLKKVSLWLRA